MSLFRSDVWKTDESLKSALRVLVQKNFRRKEILDFMKRDFSCNSWSTRTLDRRLSYFSIKYIDYDTSINEIKIKVQHELDGPGQNLGYRALAQKLRQTENLKVPRDVVYGAMYDLKPELLENRNPRVKNKPAKGHFISIGSNWYHSFDGHNQLMGYQNSTFPLAVYGVMDTSSRKVLWLKAWKSNSNPQVVANWYMEHTFRTRIIPANIRVDRGSETGDMCTIHAYLRSMTGAVDPVATVTYGPSTSNQVRLFGS